MADEKKKSIPTTKITIGKGKEKLEIEVYTYLTQGEQNEREELMLGESKYSLKDYGEGTIDPYIDIKTAHKLKEQLVRSLCVDPQVVESLDSMNPDLRIELYEKLGGILDDDKKK